MWALIGASAVSQLGDWLYNVALLGYVYSATGSAAWVGAATICRLLPYVFLGPIGGTMADRYDRRTVLFAGDVIRLVLMLSLAAVVAAEGAVASVIALTAVPARSMIRMRETSAQLGLPTPRAQRVRSLDELFAAAEKIGFPAVVKPEFGANAMGCVRVNDFEDLPGVYTLVREWCPSGARRPSAAGNDLLLEEYLDGVEFDVDLVLDNGTCVFKACRRTGRPPNRRSRRPGCTAQPTTTPSR